MKHDNVNEDNACVLKTRTDQRPEIKGFEIWLVWSDRRLTVAPGQTVLAVLEAAGVPVEPGCLSGGCGGCATPYVEGNLIHKDSCLSASERNRLFCPCVSRAEGTLVLPF